jgi:hypothetical protein
MKINSTPKPRNMTYEESKEFNLLWSDETPMEPKWLSTSNVWATADNGQLPVYAFYCTGTNSLRIFKYTWETDSWEMCRFDKLDLYSIIWKNLVRCKNMTDWDSLDMGKIY